MSSTYVSFTELDQLQQAIMEYINEWVHEKKSPVPLQEIIKYMDTKEVARSRVVYAADVLCRKGYIRRSFVISRETSFVQLRSI